MKISFLTILIVFSLASTNAQESKEIQRLKRLAGRWEIYVLNDTIHPTGATFVVKAVSNGRALYSTYRSGEYEANALWSYDKAEKVVYSLETKSNSLVWIHKGFFDEEGILILKRYDKYDNDKLVQKSKMEWIHNNKILFTMKFLMEDGNWRESGFYFMR